MQETRVLSLGQEDPLEKEMVTHSSVLAWKIPWTRGDWRDTVHEVVRVGHDLVTKPHHHSLQSHLQSLSHILILILRSKGASFPKESKVG